MGFNADVFLKGRDAGTIKFGLSASNVPIAVYAEFANPSAKKDPDFNKLMPQLMGVTLSKLQLRFEDGIADQAAAADPREAAEHG